MLRGALDRRAWLMAGGGLAAVLVVALAPGVLRDEVVLALDGLGEADTRWLWVAAVAFLAAYLCSASAWRAATGLEDRADATARYGIGSLVNSIAPAHAGDAVRLALFAQAAPDKRLRTAGKALVGVGVARLALSATLLLATVFPPALVGFALVPLLGRVATWVAGATAARLVAATAIAASLGVPSPFLAALLVLPAIDLAGLLPLTPGNVGLKSGAIALALQSKGVDVTTALASGIAFHAVETVVGLVFGSASALYLSRVPVPRWAVAGASACVAAAFVGTTVLV
ncbi:MAG TPA: lysylphosphatidylglycerol synthase domain-containing protein [Gaiellaceae bacterium]|nr:lysylphosphatidylglycerol synthase domain-containing protein [Gaiellaceae bacterium]